MTPVGWVHTAFATIALGAGATALCLGKGSRWHVIVGRLYFWSLCAVNGSAFFLYGLFGGPGPFHVLAVVSAVSIVGGYVPFLLRGPRRTEGRVLTHGLFMSWSYVGLLAAAASELSVRTLGAPLVAGVVLPSVGITVAGGILVHTLVPRSRFFGSRQKVPS